MSLEHLQLDPFTVTQLFREGLVMLSSASDVRPAEVKQPVEAPQELRYLGEHQQKVTILVQYPSTLFIPDGPLQFLTKILEACKMNLADVAIFNTASTDFSFSNVHKSISPRYVLLFGIDPLAIGLPMNFGTYKPQEYNGMLFLQAATLDDMNQSHPESKDQKLQLWNSLKQLFSI